MPWVRAPRRSLRDRSLGQYEERITSKRGCKSGPAWVGIGSKRTLMDDAGERFRLSEVGSNALGRKCLHTYVSLSTCILSHLSRLVQPTSALATLWSRCPGQEHLQ